eukprot:g13339.t1
MSRAPRRRAVALCGLVAGGGFSFVGGADRAPRRPHVARQGARQVMESFYAAVNGRDLEQALRPGATPSTRAVLRVAGRARQPFRGREGVRELLGDAMSLPKGLDFVIDDLAGGDSWGPDDAVGMTWHVEFDGVALPNSRGASLYKTKNGRLLYARDIVESPLKRRDETTGDETTLGAIGPRRASGGLAELRSPY